MKKLLGIVVLGLILVNINFINYSFAGDKFWKSDSWKNIERMNRENRKQRALEDEIRKQGSEDISEYWSLTTVGPKSAREAIDMFFEGKRLDPIEGVWRVSKWGTVAITKFESKYRVYNVNVNVSDENGTWGGTLTKTINPKVFEYFVRITWGSSGDYTYKTAPGQITLINNNSAREKIFKHAANPVSTLTRIWPEELLAWNNSIKTVKKTSNNSSGKNILTEQLKALNKLYKEGVLTDEEFSQAKQKLLN